MSKVKITNEEMQSIKAIQEKYTALGVQLVQLKLARKSGEDYLQQLDDQEKALSNEIESTNTQERELADNLNQKYGVGSLDMATGEFTPN
jgi:predicted  nucleic acid-binding Zn-ribbon protein